MMICYLYIPFNSIGPIESLYFVDNFKDFVQTVSIFVNINDLHLVNIVNTNICYCVH